MQNKNKNDKDTKSIFLRFLYEENIANNTEIANDILKSFIT